MEPSEIDISLDELENRLDRLRALYEQYFLGIEKIEPTIARKDVDRRIWVLRRTQIRNTGRRFRLQVLVQRYNTFQQYWSRICREIENGTYRRHLLKAQKTFGDEQLTWAAKKRLGGRRGATSEPPQGPASTAPPGEHHESLGEGGPDAGGDLDGAGRIAPAAASEGGAAQRSSGSAAPMPTAPAPAAMRPRVHVLEDLGPLDLDFDDDEGPKPVAQAPAARPAAAPAPAPAARPAAAPAPAPAASAGSVPAARPTGLGGAIAAAGVTRPPAAGQKPALPRRSSEGAGAPPAATPTASTLSPAPAPAAAPPPAPARPPAAASAPAPARPPAAASAPARAPGPAGALPERPSPARDPRSPFANPAARPAGPGAGAAQGLSDQRLKEIHAEYVATRRKLNQADNVSLDALGHSLRATEAKLRAQHAGRNIEFQVAIKDGKPVVKPVIRK